MVCLLATVGVLCIVYFAPAKPDAADTVMTTPQDVANYLASHTTPQPPGAPATISIPTGLYVTLVQFTGPYTVEVAGLVWQRYADNLPKDLKKGIFVPNAKDQPTLKEVYREDSGTEELIGWTFHVTLRETFNFEGKTDILIRVDGRNIFIAECKFWKGPKGLTDTIDQLLGYTSWRDTKTAIVLFNRDRELSTVLAKVPDTVRAHPNYVRDGAATGSETEFRYVLHHRDDQLRELELSVLVFEVPGATPAK